MINRWHPLVTIPKDGQIIEAETAAHGIRLVRRHVNKDGHGHWLAADGKGGIMIPIQPLRWRPVK